ncbi:MAG: ATP-dependent DNA helicase RecG [Tannerellaceae bacterium]|jgi:ATP-dependent DNA helicase RecG|nr:ATP-dependent DNA helicase RecG [Tannerellaceae bacterium]
MEELHKRDITYLRGIDRKKAETLKNEINIYTFEDLLYYFPYKYLDRSRIYAVSEINGDLPYIQLKGRILSFDILGEGHTRRLIGRFTDGTGVIDLVWFKGIVYTRNKYVLGKEYIVFGKPSEFGQSYNIVHPEIDPGENAHQVAAGLMPFYNTTEKMKKSFLNSRAIQNFQYMLLNILEWKVNEILPAALLARTQLVSLSEAMRNIHFPESPKALQAARLRLKFDELFFIQLHILLSAGTRKQKSKGMLCPVVGSLFHTFYKEHLPFALTDAQKRVIKEIRADMGSGKQMNRLLQGDVGSGKTLVALFSMLIAIDNGYQTCMMAPTEILARQHYSTVANFLGDMSDVRIALLVGSTSKRERNQILPAVASGDIDILIGTHALIENSVVFSSLGLAIIDEQHRFGVEQRAQLWKKNDIPPHVLVMTATPIPRTLAMTLYGDLDVSVIDQLPPGRKPVKTIHRYDTGKARLYEFLRKEISAGRQVYVVYPLIEESEKLDYKYLEEGYALFREIFPEYTVCMVHGRMKAAEKEAEMKKFVSGEAHILMATTVIEVGVNVPNASVMVIESAERFGLSQLHQLRGRVGRGAEQSYCILVSSYKLSADTRRRLEIMVSTNNGFEIAEADLRMRGHGDLDGTRQSGIGLNLKIADLASDGQILQYARDMAASILADDENLERDENKMLRERINVLFSRKTNWGIIS